MAPILYSNAMSPPCRAVLLAAKAIELDLEIRMVDMLNKEHLEPGFLKMNPLHTIPVLDDGDGFYLADSHAIICYLVAKYGNSDEFYPTDLQERSIVDTRLFFNAGVLQPLAGKIVKPLFHEGATSVSEALIESVNEAYGNLETMLDGKAWLAGEGVTVAEFSLIPTITSMNILVPIDSDSFPLLTVWLKNSEELPFYEDGNVEGLETFRSLISNFIA